MISIKKQRLNCEKLSTYTNAMEAITILKCMADETRMRCLNLLSQQNELCVCEFSEVLELSQPKISRHLAQLRKSALVTDRREGQWVYYRINPDLQNWTRSLIKESVTALQDEPTCQQDSQRLSQLCSVDTNKMCC